MSAGLAGFEKQDHFDSQSGAEMNFGYRLGVVIFGEVVVEGKEAASMRRSAY